MERQFRKDQHPDKKEQLENLGKVTDFFFNQLKEKAQNNPQLSQLIEGDLLNKNVPKAFNERQMRMETDFDKIEVSIANLHKVREERRQQMEEQERLKSASEFSGLIHALTLTKSNSQLLDDPLSRKGTSHDEPVDLSNISNKGERVLFELLNSLNDNLEVLDDLGEALQREKTRQSHDDLLRVVDEAPEESRSIHGKESLTIEDLPRVTEEEDSNQERRVAKGRAVFIVPEKKREMTEEEKKEKRSEMIAELMVEETAESNVVYNPDGSK